MATKKIILVFIIAALIIGNLIFLANWFLVQKQLNLELAKDKTRANILSFTSLFISKVISANGEVSFEDRLKLENSVRNINDQEIFNEWGKLTKSKDQTQAQQELRSFFLLLVSKASK